MFLSKLLSILAITLSFTLVSLAAVPKSRIDNIVWAAKRSLALLPDLGGGSQPVGPLQGTPSSKTTQNKRTPTRGKRATASTVPLAGVVQIRYTSANSKAILGYAKFPTSFSPVITFVSDKASATYLSGSSDSSGNTFEITLPSGAGGPYLGVLGYGATIGLRSHSVGPSAHTAANAPPGTITGSNPAVNYESTVWKYNSSTRELTVQWVNPNGTKVNAVFWYFAGYVFVSDPANTGPGDAVTFTLT